MQHDYPGATEKGPTVNYEADPKWRLKPITSAQLLVRDIRLESWRKNRPPLLEIVEKSSTDLLPKDVLETTPDHHLRASGAARNPIERQRFVNLEDEFGWIRCLRLPQHQEHQDDPPESAKCRWIHCSFRDQNYLKGFLWALSDELEILSDCFNRLDVAVQQHARFSKHGKYFTPCAQKLSPRADSDDSLYPMLMLSPFLDWSVLGSKPPLRFQVDRREGFRSTRSSVHQLRSILQHFYRLEDTGDREASQVFAKHKPWSTDRELDLKVRQWYGHYPTQLVVDEIWILVIDSMHVVTFSSNQTWKSRSPPLQLTSRITDVTFRGIRNAHFTSQQNEDYSAITHAITCLSGAVGILHRNFWADLILPATDRYAGWLSHLQYRLHRSPSTKLVMDLIACQEELNIFIQITRQQVKMIEDLQSTCSEISTTGKPRSFSEDDDDCNGGAWHTRATYRQLSTSTLLDPIAQLLDNLQRELTDLVDLHSNTDRLVTRTIQLVNIRLEDHGKAILVFTVVTIIFLPLNFVSSFFGMNFRDIRDMRQTQWLFWAVALCVTAGVVGGSLFLAFSGGKILEKLLMWKDKQREMRLSSQTVAGQTQHQMRTEQQGFRVLGTTGQADSVNLMTANDA